MSGLAPANRATRPPRRGRTGPRVLLFVVLPILLVLAAAAVVAGPTVADVVRDRSVRLDAPGTAGGLAKGTDPAVLKNLAGISGDYDQPVEAYYQDDEHPVVVWGGTTTIWLVELEIDAFFAELEQQGYSVSARKRLPPGPVGGDLECAETSDAEQDRYGVCLWINHGALLAFLSPQRLPAESVGRQVTRMLPDLVTRP